MRTTLPARSNKAIRPSATTAYSTNPMQLLQHQVLTMPSSGSVMVQAPPAVQLITAGGVIQPRWEPGENGLLYYTNLEETGGIQWIYNEATDRMTFNVGKENAHAMQLGDLAKSSYSWEEWMGIWRAKGWSSEEVAVPDDKRTQQVPDNEDAASARDAEFPFDQDEIIVKTDNPKMCEAMVRLWIKYRGDLRLFYNAKVGEIWHISHMADRRTGRDFHNEAKHLKALSPLMGVHSEKQMIERLGGLYEMKPVKERYEPYNKMSEILGEMPLGAMAHVSMRKGGVEDGDRKEGAASGAGKAHIDDEGHAIGVARAGNAYYVFDPNAGVYKLESLDRLDYIIMMNHMKVGEFAAPGNGAWREYGFVYILITAPDILASLP